MPFKLSSLVKCINTDEGKWTCPLILTENLSRFNVSTFVFEILGLWLFSWQTCFTSWRVIWLLYLEFVLCMPTNGTPLQPGRISALACSAAGGGIRITHLHSKQILLITVILLHSRPNLFVLQAAANNDTVCPCIVLVRAYIILINLSVLFWQVFEVGHSRDAAGSLSTRWLGHQWSVFTCHYRWQPDRQNTLYLLTRWKFEVVSCSQDSCSLA